jgi:CBS domain-containing protein
MKFTTPLLELTAEDIMSREVVTIPQTASLREAAHTLRQANVGGAAVVDEQGRCVGVISAFDFLRWAEGEVPETERALLLPVCPYLTRGHPPGDQERWICVLAPGNCPFQDIQPTTGGRHVSICLRPGISPADWQRLTQRLPADSVQRYLTADIVTVEPSVRLPELARMMMDAGIHRVFVTDDSGRPVGVVSSTDLLAALAAEGRSQEEAASSVETTSQPEEAHASA